MSHIHTADFLTPSFPAGEAATEFFRTFTAEKPIAKAILCVSALGVYVARINGERVSYPLAPGWTDFEHRVQYQEYDVTRHIQQENTLSITAACGWHMRFGFGDRKIIPNWGSGELAGNEYAVIAALSLTYENGDTEVILTDDAWSARETKWRLCNLYDGDVYDESFEGAIAPCRVISHDIALVPQEGEEIREQEHFRPIACIQTPKGETVLDFGQNLTGYVSFTLNVPKGCRIVLHHAEILDHEGNFYNDNYRSAKAEIVYHGDGERHTWKPEFTFYGFRYVRLTEFPMEVDPDAFEAIAVHSEMERRGEFFSSDEKLNQLYHNIIWGQKGNFLDIPTDCPQRDERLGWTGDAQVFARCAMYNYDTRKFFKKWLSDMRLSQRPSGAIPNVIPRMDWGSCSCGWGDAAVIVPWQAYLMYGERSFLSENYVMMKRWVDYLYREGEKYIQSGKHFGDWLAMDAETELDCGGGTSKWFLAYAFRAYSTELLIKISRILGILDTNDLEEKLAMTKATIREKYFENGMITIQTQTAHVLTLKFELCEESYLQTHADRLAELIHQNGDLLTTGFLGTPYLLHMLSQHGYTELAYTLLFQTKLPSWLYAVEHGATTMWEHWDGVRDDGTLWDVSMNSYNHYAYGAVGDFLYGTLAGIETDEARPGFKHIRFAPKPTEKLDFAGASVKTARGVVRSEWRREGDQIVYTFTVPKGSAATVTLGDESFSLDAGEHRFVR